MLRMARDEFRRNKGVTDIVSPAFTIQKRWKQRWSQGTEMLMGAMQTQIRYLISTGKTQWDGMERYIDGI
jgi:hypothetical protein